MWLASLIIAKERANPVARLMASDSRHVTRENTGYTGKGVKIAAADSGADYTHADLVAPVRWIRTEG